MSRRTDDFPRDPTGLPASTASELVELEAGARFELRIAPVSKRLGDATVRMLAYNGSIPGPTLKVRQGSEVVVDVVNDGDLETTVHWHGLRLENRYDGTHETQAPIAIGDRTPSRVMFPDPGAYWYHPHVREDYGKELGLYGNVVVVPDDPGYWPPAHRELCLTLDDVLLEDGAVAAFSRSETTYAAMGRFGDTLLVAGDPALELTAVEGELVRLYLTNTANTRVFHVALPGVRMKLVGGDSGRCEHEQLVEAVTLAPSERAVVDVLFEAAGRFALEHRTPERAYRLAGITVADGDVRPGPAVAFDVLRDDPELTAERARLGPHLAAAPDKTLAFVAEMDVEEVDGPATYVCPMHADVVRDEPGRCPKCGMKLMPSRQAAAAGADDHEHHAHNGDGAGPHDPAHAGIEWEDDMVEVNRASTPATMRWQLVDRATGAVNQAIDWRFRVGERVKIRLVNEMDSDHPMHHPFHIHGAGRFLVLARDEVVEPNLVWSDTVLVRTGETVDLLLDVTNPGRWMAHCHIAEHHESGMMFSFDVDAAQDR
jgi:FtsP/CotA-like multicopper oxidase with cupredoxin domain